MGKWFQDKSFSTEKREQGIKARKVHRAFGVLLAAAVVLQTMPFGGTAVSASESNGGGLCEHHTEHTADCGYREAEPGHECTHEHTEDCYQTVEKEDGSTTEELDCHHEHDESCGYREAAEGSPCTFVCEKCKEGTDGTPEDNTDGNEINDGDSEKAGTENGNEIEEPGDGQEENTDQQEDTGLCKHHREHDDTCGYLPESEGSEGSPCTYECRICLVEELIVALPDAADITEDNVAEVRAQLEEILALYRELTGEEQEQIDLSRCYELQEALDKAKTPIPLDVHDTQQSGDEASVTVAGENLYYSTLEEAFAAANGKTATITMLENAECVKNDSAGSPLNITSGNVTLNMNGKTLSGVGFGAYGIININGGSLSVRGNGLIEVRLYGISSRGGTLAVTETAFNLIGQNSVYANNGVLNKGGTVIINSGTFSGASDDSGQINHESGNTTINHAEMTGTTADNPVGVCYSEEGTLTINGGTFSNITVGEFGLINVKSVAELLGKGCAFRHQDGTWTTDEEMAGKTLDNVTVQKIPLTINPQSETLWYYNGSPHTLAMNAAPVDSGVISYVWKNGADTLDCTADNYEIPADMPVGSYTYTCEATCDGYTLSHKFSFEILKSGTQFVGDGTVKTYKGSVACSDFTADDTITVKATPTATGRAPVKAAARLRGYTAPAAGQMAVYVGDIQVSNAASVNSDGSYTMTVSAADVLQQGQKGQDGKFALLVKFVENDSMAGEKATAKVTIIPNPLTADMVTMSAANVTYNGAVQRPTVTVSGLTEGTDYDITYSSQDFANAGTVQITVTGKGSYEGTVRKTFTIQKATPAVKWDTEEMTVTYTGQPANIRPTVTLVNHEPFSGTINYKYGNYSGSALPADVGTYRIKAGIAEQGNYNATESDWMTLYIDKASAPTITYPTAGSITYGQRLSDSALTGGSTKYGTFAWKDGSTVPAVDDTTGYAVVFTASEETEKNYETITDTTQNVPVKVEKAVPAVSIKAAVSGSEDSRQAVLTVNVAKAGAGAFPTGTVKLMDCTGGTETEIRTVTLNSSGTASYTWKGLLDKEYTIKAVYEGDNNYADAESRKLVFDAGKENQQGFRLDPIGAKTYGSADVTLATTGGSGTGAVRYKSSDEDVIRIENGRAVIVGAGAVTITAIKEEDNTYNEAFASEYVIVAKKALTVTARDKTVVRGQAMPAFTYIATGLVNGDTFTKDPSMTTSVQNTDTLGRYDIVINGGTLRNSGSYQITYVNGILNIAECFYNVTVVNGTGGGEYAEGDTVTVTANDRSGYTFTGWSSADGVTFANNSARTTTFTMPAKAVTVKADYSRNSSGNSGGGSGGNGNSGGSAGNSASENAGGNEENGGQDSEGNNTNPGNGNPPRPVPQPAGVGTNPGNETTPGTNLDSGTKTSVQGMKQPFIKGEDGKIGWDVIRAEEEKVQKGSIINVDMNGAVVVPGDIFDSMKGKDITITFDMGNGILWSVDGKSITTDKADDIDLSVKTGVSTVPVDIVNNVTGESYNIQISLSYEGEFGFTAVLSIGLGKENAGYTASLYYYNESTGELEFICKDQIAEDGTASLAFTHASDYVIVIDEEQEEENGGGAAIQSEDTSQMIGDKTVQDSDGIPGGPDNGQTGGGWWILAVLLLVIAIGAGVFVAVKKKER